MQNKNPNSNTGNVKKSKMLYCMTVVVMTPLMMSGIVPLDVYLLRRQVVENTLKALDRDSSSLAFLRMTA